MRQILDFFMPQIVLSPLLFYCPGDERTLFRWIKEIKSVIRVEGVGDSLVLHFRTIRISNRDLRELIGLFARYKFRSMSQLAQFQSRSNGGWFTDSHKLWHRQIFPSKNRKLRL
jgi:hypothetical protein